MGTWLGALGFSGEQIGLTYGTTALAAMISPFFVGMFADRFFATQRLLAVLHLAGAVALFYASTQTAFWPLYIAVLVHTLFYMPTLALTNSLSFRQMRIPGVSSRPCECSARSAGLSLASSSGRWASRRRTADAAGRRGIASWPRSVSLLPHTPRSDGPREGARGARARRAALDEGSIVRGVRPRIVPCVHPAAVLLRVRESVSERHRRHERGGEDDSGQMSEIVFMLLMPWFFKRLGVKQMFLVGMAAWVARYILFATATTPSWCGCSTAASCCTASVRLLLRHGSDIRRSESAAAYARRGAGVHHLRYLRRWHADRLVVFGPRGRCLCAARRCRARLAEHLDRAGGDGGRRARFVRALLPVDRKAETAR